MAEDEQRAFQSAEAKTNYVARFLCTKHSWKGKYNRIFSVGDNVYVGWTPWEACLLCSWMRMIVSLFVCGRVSMVSLVLLFL